MAARAIASGNISFGLVSIPVKLYTSAASEQIRFNILHKKCGGRIRQQFYCPTDDEVVERDDTVRGYEYARGQYVQFTDEELKALETERSNSIEIVEFVPSTSVDPVQIERSYYLGPDKGGDKAYKLLGQSMRRTGKIAVGRWAGRGKEQLVVIRPFNEGLLLHQLYYASEVRAFDEVETGATFKFSEVEQDLADKLVAQLSTDEFESDKYRDAFRDRVQAAVDEKVAGKEITIAPEQPKAQIIDLFEALKKSLSAAKPPPPATPKPPRKAEDRTERAEPAKKTRAKRSAK